MRARLFGWVELVDVFIDAFCFRQLCRVVLLYLAKVNVERLPPCGKLDLPRKLALILGNVCLAIVPAAFDVCLAYPAARANVDNLLFFLKVLLCNSCIEPAATLAHRKIWQYLNVLVLTDKLGYLFPKLAAVPQ